jgi:hypothetical protein
MKQKITRLARAERFAPIAEALVDIPISANKPNPAFERCRKLRRVGFPETAPGQFLRQ